MARSDETEQGSPQKENQWFDDWIKDIPDLSAKVAIVTGSNSGTGFWAAHALAGKGCTVVLACRSLEKAAAAKQDILSTHKDAKLDVIQLDNMKLSSVRAFAKTFDAKYDRLDYLLNNAGIMAQPARKSEDGYDVQFQTNHLSHFLLTKLLWDKMLNSPGQSRVVNHSSAAHKMCDPVFDKDRIDNPTYSWGWFGINVLMFRILFPLMGMTPADNWMRYGVSKLCNVLMMRQLQKKIDDKSLTDKVIAVACHPGYASTGLQYHARDSMPNWQSMNEKGAQSAADGSLPMLMAAIAADIVNGDYTGPSNGGSMGPEMNGPPKKCAVGGNGNDADMARSLWDFSEECVGEKFAV